MTHGILRGKAHQATFVAHFVHHRIAHIRAGAARNTFVLQAITNVDARRTDLNTHGAIDTSPQLRLGQVDIARTRATGLTTLTVVSDDERVMVKHGALKARIRTHVFANLLTHKTCVAIGRKGVEEHPKQLPRTHVRGEKLHG